MCNLSQPQVPRGWQRVCQKAKMPLESRDPCSLFLSPNGKTFKTMDEVHRYSKVLHLEKLAREQKKMEAKNLKLDTSGVLKRKVGDSTELACTRCEKSFVNMVMVKKHYKEAHIGGSHVQSSETKTTKELSGSEAPTSIIAPANNPPTPDRTVEEEKLAQERAKESLMKLSGVAVSSKNRPPPQVPPTSAANQPNRAANPNSAPTKSIHPPAKLPPLARLPLSQACMQPQLLHPAATLPHLVRPGPTLSQLSDKQPPIPTKPPSPPARSPQLIPKKPPGPERRLPWLPPSFIGGPPKRAPGPPLGPGPPKQAPGPPLAPRGPSHRAPPGPPKPPGPGEGSLGAIRRPPGPPSSSSANPQPVTVISKSYSLHRQQERLRKRKVLRPPTNSSGQKKKRPPGGNKTEITVSQTCRFLELNDYPLAVANHSTEFLADFDKFSRFFMPLVASVNPGRSKLRVETLVMAKWLALGFKSNGSNPEASVAKDVPQPHSSFFRKPKGNKIRLNIMR